jgi:hypothetical protein
LHYRLASAHRVAGHELLGTQAATTPRAVRAPVVFEDDVTFEDAVADRVDLVGQGGARIGENLLDDSIAVYEEAIETTFPPNGLAVFL